MIGTKLRKFVNTTLICFMTLMPFTGAVSAAESASDVNGSWAATTLNEWLTKGWLHGYPDGSVKPGNTVTRAEFFTLANNAMGLTEIADISFSDVKAGDWQYDQVAKAVKAGYVHGYEDGTVRPDNQVSREEVAVMTAAVLHLDLTQGDASKFSDVSDIASWSKSAVGALVSKSILNGYPDGTYKPKASITRAEAVVILDKAVKAGTVTNASDKTYDKAGTYGPATGTETVAGNVKITVPDVTLQNMTIKGDLILGSGIGEGDVNINGVTVLGKTVVNGGGANSVHFKDSVFVTIIVNKQTGTVRIVVEGSTTVKQVTLQSSAKVEESGITGGGVSSVELAKDMPANSQVTLLGSFDSVVIHASSIKVDIPSGSVDHLNVSTGAKDDIINTGQDVKIVSLVLDAVAKLLGTGTIQNATINDGAQGSTFDKKPEKTDGTQSGSIVVGGTSTTTTSGGGGGGGGSTTTSTLATAKATAKGELATAFGTYIQANYEAADWTTLTAAKTNGDAAIDAATDTAGVTTAKNTALAAMDAVQTTAEKAAAALATAKTTAKNELSVTFATYTQANYEAADWTTLTAAKTNGDAAIDAATDTAGVTTAKNTALAAMDAVQTTAEKAAAALATAKTTAKNELSVTFATYTQANYDAADWTTLTTAKTNGDTAIDAATNTAGVTAAKNTALAAMDAVKTIAEKAVAHEAAKITVAALGDIWDCCQDSKVLVKAQALVGPGYTVTVKEADGTYIDQYGVARHYGTGTISFTVSDNTNPTITADTPTLTIVVFAD